MQTFHKLHQKRRDFLLENKNKDFVVLDGLNCVLLSAPHGVSQTRMGKNKMQEPGSLATALNLKQRSSCFLIAKTKNNFDDANFDLHSKYKNAIQALVKKHNIKYIIDIHGLAKHRPCDVNLGISLGQNIASDVPLFEMLYNKLVEKGFKTVIDNPFMGGYATVAGSMKKKFPQLWTIQIEINSALSNEKENIQKWNTLLDTLLDFICTIEKR